MNWILVILIVLVVVVSIAADYLWRRWMADRKRDRQ